MNWIVVVIVLLTAQKQCMTSPTPLKLPGHTQLLTPYIKHWEAANFDRTQLHHAHQKHIEQKRHRRKRDLKTAEYGPAHTIRLNFFAHDREFRLVLRQNPLSVFAGDVQIENTGGPVEYDISRIYTGSLEDDESAHVYAILTNDNLLDGTIETKSEQYYLEPSQRYSRQLHKSGVHSIVYKVSDVNMQKAAKNDLHAKTSANKYCASEAFHRNLSLEKLKSRSVGKSDTRRFKRWLPEEMSPSGAESRNPPLPLDLDVPYNDEFSIFTHQSEKNTAKQKTTRLPKGQANEAQEANIITWRTSAIDKNQRGNGNDGDGDGDSNSNGDNSRNPLTPANSTANLVHNRNIILNNYNPNIENRSNNNSVRKTYTKHKNILVSTYNNKANNDPHDNTDDFDANAGNNDFINTNWTTLFGDSSVNDRPSHKTHVEIITKNGATRKPNIIVNNYNPDITMVSQNRNNPNFSSMLMTNLLSGRSQQTPSMNDAGAGSSTRSIYDRKITCMLYLQADHTFFQKMGTDEASIEAITRHVQRANSIYKNTDFNNDGKPDNITFMIKRIKVHNANAVKDPAYRFPGNYGVEKFLELFSEEDYDAFCLAYMFTYRDFEMGTLGLAWTGDLKNAGGVCEKNGHYRGSLKSLNTGIVTLLNYGKHVPPAVSHVTLAHEIGHNFGSPHDPEQCTPGGEDGNFIMFARATSGDKKNNNNFSPCSLKSIEPVLNAKARSVKGCFTEPQTSICGNGVVEPGEQCDCGWEEDCKDSCCFPMSRHPRIDEKPCSLTPRAKCSPSQGPCCTTGCKLKFGDKCRDDNGCRDPSFCDGHMPQCPPSVNKPNKTICNKEFVCYMGECTGSICLAYGLESCQCIPGPNDDKMKSCELCCKLPGENNPCRSSFEWNESPFDVPDMYAKPGTPCNDYNGYCDVFQKCREVDPSGPLATLRKLLLSEESIATFKKWMYQNWYTVVLAIMGVFVLLVLSTKLLAKRSNLKLKSVTIIHSATTETVRLPDDNNGVIVHTAIRTKVPFKKKVRGERSSSNKNSNNCANNKSKAIAARTSKFAKSMGTTGQTQVRSANPLSPVDGEMKKRKRDKKSHTVMTTGETEGVTKGNAVTTALAFNSEKQPNESVKKTAKKLRNHNREIIDYSARNNLTEAGTSSAHTNTFGKVQRWLLESPIVAQPLSHIEHHSKIRKVISKSHSTPERLVQKSPQKTKSVGNLSANEKVKLQVVYKPPFKFSLRLSKNAKVKTNKIISGNVAAGKAKRPSRTFGSNDGKHARSNKNVDGIKNLVEEKTKRSAFLLRGNTEEDSQILTLSEPNYETLTPKQTSSKMENPFYENMLFKKDAAEENTMCSAEEPFMGQLLAPSTKMSHNSSKTAMKCNSVDPLPHQAPHAYSSSGTHNPFSVAAHNKSGKLSEGNSANNLNLNRNFGSTQNLINSSQSNLNKSKKRSSLNLKTSHSRSNKNAPGLRKKHSNSNTSLYNDSSPKEANTAPTVNEQMATQLQAQPLRRSTSNKAAQQVQRQISSTAATTRPTSLTSLSAKQFQSSAPGGISSGLSIAGKQQMEDYPVQRQPRGSNSNIPRATISSSPPVNTNNSQSNYNFSQKPPTNATFVSNFDNWPGQNATNTATCQAVTVPTHQCSDSLRQQQHNCHTTTQQLAKTANATNNLNRNSLDHELIADINTIVSDVENLVS